MKQKHHDGNDDADDKPKAGVIQSDPEAEKAVEKAKGILGDLDKALAKKRGHWEECCGVRRWVPD